MRKIKLYTRDNKLVTELEFEKNTGLYVMVEKGTAPDIIMWGERFFVVEPKISDRTYIEEFCMAVF